MRFAHLKPKETYVQYQEENNGRCLFIGGWVWERKHIEWGSLLIHSRTTFDLKPDDGDLIKAEEMMGV